MMPMLDRRTFLNILALLTTLAGPLAVAAHEGHEGIGSSALRPMKTRPALALGVAVAPDKTLWIAGLDAQGKLFVQTRRDSNPGWDAPRLLNTAGDTIAADGENRPKLAFGPGGSVVISYTKPLAKPYTGEIRLLRSTDGGQSFAAPITLHHDRQLITHRFESIAFDGQGRLHAVWVDKRDQLVAPKGTPYRGAAIYRNVSLDGGASFGPDIKLADHSCECCRIALARTPSGDIAALWRHVFAPNIRDHAFAILGKSGDEPVRASLDEWKFDACPHHGPGLAAAADGGFHAVWFGFRNGTPAVRYGRLDARGTPTGATREVPDAAAEHADVAAVGTTVAVVWRSFDGTQTRLRAWISGDEGAHFTLRELSASGEENDHPRLVATTDAIRVVWRTETETHVIPLAP